MLKICTVCNSEFTARSNSRTCSKECSQKNKKRTIRRYSYQQYLNNLKYLDKKALEKTNYRDRERYTLFRYSSRNRCDQCGTPYNATYEHTHTRRYGHHTLLDNVTPWGSAVCPNPKCGLIAYNPYYDTSIPDDPQCIATQEEYEEIYRELSNFTKFPRIKKQAIYKDKNKTKIDFKEEAKKLRQLRNYLCNDIGDYTDEELKELSNF